MNATDGDDLGDIALRLWRHAAPIGDLAALLRARVQAAYDAGVATALGPDGDPGHVPGAPHPFARCYQVAPWCGVCGMFPGNHHDAGTVGPSPLQGRRDP